ncbi:methylated-DNA--[protein]-cysteine S-methyltransferase [Rickettsiales bacterium LUAb2]
MNNKKLKIIVNNINLSKYQDSFDTIIGKLTLLFDDQYLYQILFANQFDSYLELIADLPNNSNHNISVVTKYELQNYFSGKPVDFSKIPYKLNGTIFQTQVFKAMLQIKYGETISYEQFTNDLLLTKAIRAVTSQIGKNPIPIIVPCHRIIGKNGSLTGYAGGLNTKQQLLDLEANLNL